MKPFRLIVLPVAILVAACTQPAPARIHHRTARTPAAPASGTPAVAPIGKSCPGSALRGVYHPWRLRVLGTCATFVGLVTGSRLESDGDHHVYVAPSAGYGRFLDGANRSIQHRTLVVEIVPGQRIPIPAAGERVAVLGTWARDLVHGWNEIHPVWSIRNLDTGTRYLALPPRRPLYNGRSLRRAAQR